MQQLYHRVLLLLLAVTATLAVSAQGAKIYHSRNGQLTPFLRGEIQTAIEYSQPNDTIFLGEGTYPGFNYVSPVTIVGQGNKTIIAGDVHILCNGIEHIAILDGLEISGYILQDENVQDILIRNTGMQGYVTRTTTTTPQNTTSGGYDWRDANNFSFISCYFKNVCGFLDSPGMYGGHLKDINFINCYFEQGLDDFRDGKWNPDAGAINLINCTLPTPSDTMYYTLSATNCIFRGPGAPLVSSLSILKNCAFEGEIAETTPLQEGCYTLSSAITDFTPETLLARGLVGTDGTAIGHLGGNIPFSQEPSLPYISDKKVEVDYENNVINVTLKFSGLEE